MKQEEEIVQNHRLYYRTHFLNPSHSHFLAISIKNNKFHQHSFTLHLLLPQSLAFMLYRIETEIKFSKLLEIIVCKEML